MPERMPGADPSRLQAGRAVSVIQPKAGGLTLAWPLLTWQQFLAEQERRMSRFCPCSMAPELSHDSGKPFLDHFAFLK